jgi:hypothetical protein
MGVCVWLTPGPGRCTHGEVTRYPLYMRLNGSRGAGRDGSEKSLHYRNSNPVTVQPVAGRNTGYILFTDVI